MNREEVRKLLGENATEEQISAVLNKFHTEQKNLNEQVTNLQGQVNNLTTEKTELLGYKTKVEEIERANLSKEEQLQLKEQELNKKMAQADILQNSIKAKSILVGAGVGEEEADKLVASIVKEDEQATIDSATLFANQFNNIKEVTAKQTREELANLDLKPNPSNIPPNSKAMTWENFSKLSAKEQAEFAEKNPEEFAKL